VCKPGQVKKRVTCVPCDAGTYFVAGECSLCGVKGTPFENTYSEKGALFCTRCPAGSTSVEGAKSVLDCKSGGGGPPNGGGGPPPSD